MRRALKLLAVLLLIGLAGFFLFGPGIVERGMNRVVAKDLPPVSPQARALHERLLARPLKAEV